MRVCVTGGAGFVGSHLVERLLADGHDVVVIDNLSTGNLANLGGCRGAIEFVEGDIRDLDAVSRAVHGAEVVFHQAAMASVARSVERPVEVCENNVNGTLNVLVAARDTGARRVVFASSSSVYGDTPELPKSEAMRLRPRSPYAASKAAGEVYVQAFHAAYGLEGVALRYFNVYGPRQSPDSQYAAVIPLFTSALLAGRAPTIYGDGEQTRDFTFVRDVVEANCRAADAVGAPGHALNVGGGSAISINELVSVITEATGAQIKPEYEAPRIGDVLHSLADLSLTGDLLGWTPGTPLREGIRSVVENLRSGGRTVKLES